MRRPASERGTQAADATIEHLRSICADVGFDLDQLTPFVRDRLRMLADASHTAADSERMAAAAREVFAHYDANKPAERWSETERRTVVLACVFSDIGKTGPVHADADGQRLIAEMFSVEGVKDETQSVETFLHAHFPEDADERVRRFRSLGLDPSMTMRTFWNLHTLWTFDIVDAGGVPREAVAAAATHHFLDDVNPNDVVAADGRYSRPFGENVAFDRAEKLVIALDKYDAARRRGACTHEQAIAWLRRWIATRERFRADEELSTVIADLDVAMTASR